jgi:hypothetical protein
MTLALLRKKRGQFPNLGSVTDQVESFLAKWMALK